MRYWALRPDTSDRNSTRSTSSVSCMAERGNNATGTPGTACRIARATSPWSRGPTRAAPANAHRRRPRPRAKGRAVPAAAPGAARRATRAPRGASAREHPPNDGRRLRPRLTQLGGVARPRRSEVRPAPTLPAAHRRDRARDFSGFHTALHQVIRNRDMHTGPVAVSEQHRDRPLVTRPERIHQRPDLVAVVEIALIDVQLDVTNAFHVARCTLPAGPEQLFNLLLELAVFLQQRFDPLDQVFRLRLEHARRLRELLLEPADQGVGAQPRHRLDAAYAGGRTGLVREPKQRDLARGRDVRPAAQLERD